MIYSDEFKNKIVELYNSGVSSPEISKTYNVHNTTVLNWVRKKGYKTNSKISLRYTKEFKKKIINLYMNGKTTREIEKEYGVTDSTISRWVKQAGFEMRPNVKNKYTKEFKKKIARLYVEGVSPKKLIEKHNVCEQSIYNWVRKFYGENHINRNIRHNDEIKKKLVNLYMNGESAYEIGKPYKISGKTIKSWANNFGFEEKDGKNKESYFHKKKKSNQIYKNNKERVVIEELDLFKEKGERNLQEIKYDFLKLRKKGFSYFEIGQRFDLSPKTVWKLIWEDEVQSHKGDRIESELVYENKELLKEKEENKELKKELNILKQALIVFVAN